MASRCVLIHQLLLGHEIGLNLGLQLVKQRDDLLDGAHFGVQSGRVHHGSQDQGADQHREIKTRVLEPRVRVRKNGEQAKNRLQNGSVDQLCELAPRSARIRLVGSSLALLSVEARSEHNNQNLSAVDSRKKEPSARGPSPCRASCPAAASTRLALEDGQGLLETLDLRLASRLALGVPRTRSNFCDVSVLRP